MAKSENKTQTTDADARAFLDGVEHPVRSADVVILDALFRKITGWAPRMWGAMMVGYGSYHYVYDSGREGDWLATGFSPRKANLSLYIMQENQGIGELLDRLGKHKVGKGCLTINTLDDVDIAVLEEIIRVGLADLHARWPVLPG